MHGDKWTFVSTVPQHTYCFTPVNIANLAVRAKNQTKPVIVRVIMLSTHCIMLHLSYFVLQTEHVSVYKPPYIVAVCLPSVYVTENEIHLFNNNPL